MKNLFKKAVCGVLSALMVTVSLPMVVVANEANDEDFAPLRQTAYEYNATVEWESETGTAIITTTDGSVHRINIAQVGGFIESGRSFVPQQVLANVFVVDTVVGTTISLEEAIADFEEAINIFRTAHPSITATYREFGHNLDTIAAELLQRYDKFEDLVGLFEHATIIEDLFTMFNYKPMGLNAILHASGPMAGASLIPMLEQAMDVLPDAVVSYQSDLLNDVRVVEINNRLLQLIAQNTPESEQEDTERPANVTLEIFEEESAALITILDFDDMASAPAILEMYEEIAHLDNLIIDISQNGGGNHLFWWNYIVQPNITEFPEGVRLLPSFFRGDPRVIYQFEVLDRPVFPISYFEESWDLADFPLLNMDDLAEMTHVLQLYLNSERLLAPLDLPEAPAFDGEIFVIIGPISFSNADSFPRFVRQTGFATLVGEPSGGGGAGADAMWGFPNMSMIFTLPSGLLIGFDTVYAINEVGQWSAVASTLPDIWTIEGKTALETALEHITQGRME